MLTRRRIAGIAGVAVVLAGAGVAYAAWTASGTGGGAVSSTTAQALVVTAGAGSGDLYPSDVNTGALSLSIHNPNDYPVTVTTLGADSGSPVDLPNQSCNVSALHASEAVHIPVAEGATVNWTSSTKDVQLPFAANDNCQGITFSFSAITATGLQAADFRDPRAAPIRVTRLLIPGFRRDQPMRGDPAVLRSADFRSSCRVTAPRPATSMRCTPARLGTPAPAWTGTSPIPERRSSLNTARTAHDTGGTAFAAVARRPRWS